MPSPAEQLDLFAHAVDVGLRNDVLAALERRDAPAAAAARAALADAYTGDHTLGPIDILIGWLGCRFDAPAADAAAATRERLLLAEATTAAARAVFGAVQADAWLRREWSRLAAHCAGLGFDAAHVDVHAAPLQLHAGEWAAAAEATGTIASWRRTPAPLGWMFEARFRLDGLDAVWPLWAELAWLAPRRLAEIQQRLQSARLAGLQRRFEAEFEGASDASDLAWFPAWLVNAEPALAPSLGQALTANQTPPERAMRLVLDLLALERQGRHADLVQRRAALRELSDSLYGVYLSTR